MPESSRGDSPAYPSLTMERCPSCGDAIPAVSGLSKREIIATHLMQTLMLIEAGQEGDEITGKDLAQTAVAYADDLLSVCATVGEAQ